MFGRQADFFDRLRERCDFRVADLVRYADMSESTATRKARGQTELTVGEARQLIARHPDMDVRCEVAEYVVSGTGTHMIVLPDEGGAVGEDTAATLESLAGFVRERAAHLGDGVLEPHERERQEELVRHAARDVQRLLVAVSNQTTTRRRKARPLGLVEGGAA